MIFASIIILAIGLLGVTGYLIYTSGDISELTGYVENPYICPINSSNVRSIYRVGGYDNCFCITGTRWNSSNSTCEQCPLGSSTIESSKKALGFTGCYCLTNRMWNEESKMCIEYPEGTTIVNTGIPVPIYQNLYCSIGRTWDDENKKCIMCPTGSSTSISSIPIPDRPNCYCESGKVWNAGSKTCDFPICEGHGKYKDNICVCDTDYYLYNNTYCTKCLDGNINDNICTCSEDKSFSSSYDGCVVGT